MQSRTSLVLAAGSLLLVIAAIAGYHADMAAGHFLERRWMAAVGLEVLFGAMAAAGALVAMAKGRWWISPKPAAYRGQAFVNAPAAAFIAGMLAYLIVYPPTPWVFYTMIGMAFVFGAMLTMPMDAADAPAAVALLNAATGLAAAAAGFANRNGVLVMAGALLAAAGFTLSIVARTPVQQSPFRALLRAFSEPTQTPGGPPANWD